MFWIVLFGTNAAFMVFFLVLNAVTWHDALHSRHPHESDLRDSVAYHDLSIGCTVFCLVMCCLAFTWSALTVLWFRVIFAACFLYFVAIKLVSEPSLPPSLHVYRASLFLSSFVG